MVITPIIAATAIKARLSPSTRPLALVALVAAALAVPTAELLALVELLPPAADALALLAAVLLAADALAEPLV